MDPEQLWIQHWNQQTNLIASVMDDAWLRRDSIDLDGDQVEPRKQFIQKYAKDVRFLDI
jgi:DNA gyrase subunit B